MVSPSSFCFIVMAADASKKDTTMRRNERSGAQVWTGAYELISSRMVTRLLGWKMDGSWRFWRCVSGAVFVEH